MNEMNQNVNTETTENKPVSSYVITRFENGDVRVENNTHIEGTIPLSNEGLYKDIEDVAESIKNRRLENAAYRGIYRFYAEMEQKEAAAQAQASGIDPTV